MTTGTRPPVAGVVDVLVQVALGARQNGVGELLGLEEVLVGVMAAVPVGRAGVWLARHPATTVIRWRL
jgi:hypothetical protein